MSSKPDGLIEHRLKNLEHHLAQENPVLLQAVQSFRALDLVAYRLGLLPGDASFATQIPWWPLIAVLGTFSSGKSTFINHYLGSRLQRTGNQAVDDKFTVICYSRDEQPHVLPGVALNSDPRFPFYQISADIDLVAKGEGERIDAYLQLKTCPARQLKGKILIDSPGFDADAQRTSTLRITDHIMDLSDLVLVFFDARHPEPGAMRDTLDHLVSATIKRPDSGKFLYILNQLDTTAREDNPEDVIAAWQRALGERGLTAGRFYTVYSPEAAVPIADESLRRRFESKRDADLGEIHQRMHQVEVERAYRIMGVLEKTARDIEEKTVPVVTSALRLWRRRVLAGDAAILALVLVLLFGVSVQLGWWQGLSFQPPWSGDPGAAKAGTVLGVLALLAGLAIHFGVRSLAARSVLGWLRRQVAAHALRGDVLGMFDRSTRPWRSIFLKRPAGWGRRSRAELSRVLDDTDTYVQTLNDRFTNPSGDEGAPPPAVASA
ncbi:MAG: dynamin family protein [Gammaproteobacteria bacterium]|nr:dynamin family protein [Gammaproteobacteria bacterium]